MHIDIYFVKYVSILFASIQTYPQPFRLASSLGEVNRMPQDSNEQFQQFFLQLQVAPLDGGRMEENWHQNIWQGGPFMYGIHGVYI